MYCNNNFSGKYWAIVDPKIIRTTRGSGLPRDDCMETNLFLTQLCYSQLKPLDL
jgi:hypothetical protein